MGLKKLRILNIKAIEGPTEIEGHVDKTAASADNEHEHKYDLFLSYRVSSDAALVTTLYDKIKAQQPELKVFLDKKELEAGVSWENGFSEAIMSSRMVAIVMSRRTFACDHGSTCKACLHNIARLESEEYCDNVILGSLPLLTPPLPLIVVRFNIAVSTILILMWN